MNDSDPKLITALVCTRNRGDSIKMTLSTILANTHPNFELIVVDQSTNEETALAVRPFLSDPRLRYLPSATQGKARASNIGLGAAYGEVIAMTDDDCTVPAHWLETIAAVFAEHPDVAVAFCNVNPASYDSTLGFIPAYQRTGSQLLSSAADKCKARGIGAGIAVRRLAVLEIGGFDEMLGPGAVFPSCDDGDIAVRALLQGYEVYETDSVAVEHAGFRTWAEGRQLSHQNWIGIGAAYAKPLKCGYWHFAVVPAYELARFVLWPPFSDLLHWRRPRGLARIRGFLRGLIQSWRTPVDPKTLLFRPVNDTEVLCSSSPVPPVASAFSSG